MFLFLANWNPEKHDGENKLQYSVPDIIYYAPNFELNFSVISAVMFC